MPLKAYYLLQHSTSSATVFITVLLTAVLLATGCTRKDQIHSALQHETVALEAGALETHGLAFVTPSASTGLEEDREAIALMFATRLSELRPDIPVSPG